MKTKVLLNSSILLGIFAFNFLFWQERMGLNSLIFCTLLLIVLYFFNPKSWRERTVQITALGTFITAIMIVWHGSVIAKFVHIISFFCLVGAIEQKNLRYVWFALLSGLLSILSAPLKMLDTIAGNGNVSQRTRQFTYYSKLAIIPLLIAAVFFMIYRAANTEFHDLSQPFVDMLGRIFSFDIDLTHFFFYVFALFVVGGMLWRGKNTFLTENQSEKQYALRRNRPIKEQVPRTKTPLALKNEYRMAMMTFITLNALLLLVNWTDIRQLWFGFDVENPPNLKFYVHQGTYLLIFAIALAMSVLLLFFRKNLNFYPNNKQLKTASYIWIAQNAFLALSVGLRNYRYIDFHGLAYKRIGVIIFLVLVLFGLFTMYSKVKKSKTVYYLLEKNGWAVYVIFVLMTFINWDVFITKYNLFTDTRSNIDVSFLIRGISDKNLYLLEEHQVILENKPSYPKVDDAFIDHEIRQKRSRFENKRKHYSWKSWTYTDQQNIKSTK